MMGVIIVLVSLFMLVVGLYSISEFDRLNNHKPFSEVDYLDYLFAALGAALITPASIFGIFAGIMIIVANYLM